MKSDYIDLRSDTVTQPSPEMLNFMFNAQVGDDVFGEDPTVKELEQTAADLFLHESALFCPSGTMANQLAAHVSCRPGDEIICDELSHIYQYESGALAANSGIQVKLIKTTNGFLTPENLQNSINADFDWLTRTRMVVIENTGNKWGGNYYSLEQLTQLSKFCKEKKLLLHCDGARIFNACVAGNYEPKNIGPLFDSLSVCLSKGLGAPVGSLLIGNKNFIKEARRVRKRWGGGMRQIGYLAAAGIYALKKNITRLNEDHKKAEQLETILKNQPYVSAVLPVYTNIVIFNLIKEINPIHFLNHLEAKKIKAIQMGPQSVRMVTHLDVKENQFEKVIQTLKTINSYL